VNLKELFNLTYYTSKLDQFLIDFDKSHPRLSASQLAEKEKYDRIYALRDNANQPEPKTTLWDKF